jgi:hypothetical protein
MGMSEKWTRLDDSRLRNATKSGPDVEARTYGLNGRPWPRISVVVQEHWTGKGWGVYCDRKEGPGAWWQEKAPMPLEALQDVPEMVQALLARLERKAA